MFNVQAHTILLSRHGSHAYGLAIESSDEDWKGVCVPPREYFLGYANRFEQSESREPDKVIYDVRKFFALATECNPNIIEVLWSDEADYVFTTAAGRKLIDARDLFISKKARWAFSGYAISQLKRIRTHRRWLTNPPSVPPSRADLGLPERTVIPKDQLQAALSAVDKRLSRWNLTDMAGLDDATRVAVRSVMADMLAEIGASRDEAWKAAARSLSFDENFLHLLDRERQYNAKRVEWEQFENWKANRNPKRAADEARFGFDLKHGMHLCRLMKMCREILTTGKVIVKRVDDREELLAIRAGEWSYDRLVEWAEQEDAAMGALYDASTLPHHADRVKLDRLCIEIVEESLAHTGAVSA